jgi:hypothetical protein
MEAFIRQEKTEFSHARPGCLGGKASSRQGKTTKEIRKENGG